MNSSLLQLISPSVDRRACLAWHRTNSSAVIARCVRLCARPHASSTAREPGMSRLRRIVLDFGRFARFRVECAEAQQSAPPPAFEGERISVPSSAAAYPESSCPGSAMPSPAFMPISIPPSDAHEENVMFIQNREELTSHGDREGRALALDILEAGLVAADPYTNMCNLFRIEGDKLLRRRLSGEGRLRLRRRGDRPVARSRTSTSSAPARPCSARRRPWKTSSATG